MIDHERLAELEADFGSDELRQIIDVFLEEAGETVERLGAEGDDPGVRGDRLHFLKGCARAIGAGRLGDLCDRLERAATFGADDRARLEREFRALREALDRRDLLEAG